MTEEIISVVALAVALFVGITVYRKRIHGKSKKQKFIEKAKKSGHYAKGIASDVQTHFGDRTSNDAALRNPRVIVSYKFHVSGKDYYKRLIFQRPGVYEISYPSSVTVYYDPRNPLKAVCGEEESEPERRGNGCLAAMVSSFVTMAIILLIAQMLTGGSLWNG